MIAGKGIGSHSAFACPADDHGNGGSGGLTIREYLATAALQGLAANPALLGAGLAPPALAELALELTDALLSNLQEP